MSTVDGERELTREDVREILDIVDRSHFGEVRIELGDIQVYVRKTGEHATTQPAEAATPASAHRVPVASTAPAAEQTGGSMPSEPDTSGRHLVTAPMVGTFYRSPAPGDPPFVQIGDQVAADDVVCLLEVMKLFNSVTAEVAGRVVDILVADGATVEYGQPVVAIEPAEQQ